MLASLPTGEAEAEPVLSGWYGPGFENAPTASGVVYRPEARAAAHPSLPFGTQLLVTYGGRKTVVEVTDRGPYVGDRGLDLSKAAAEEVGLTAAGADSVDVQVLAGGGRGEASHGDYTPRITDAVTPKSYDRESLRLVERPYLKVLAAAFTPYSRPSTSACQDASIMFSPTPTAPQTRLLSVESMRTRVVAAVARCSSSIRTL